MQRVLPGNDSTLAKPATMRAEITPNHRRVIRTTGRNQPDVPKSCPRFHQIPDPAPENAKHPMQSLHGARMADAGHEKGGSPREEEGTAAELPEPREEEEGPRNVCQVLRPGMLPHGKGGGLPRGSYTHPKGGGEGRAFRDRLWAAARPEERVTTTGEEDRSSSLSDPREEERGRNCVTCRRPLHTQGERSSSG